MLVVRMSATKPTDEEAAVLAANEAFYGAFSRGDYQAMAKLWAQHTKVACLHPGAPLLSGREAVMHSWEQILNQAADWNMRCRDPSVHVLGSSAFVTCLEANGDESAHLAATNIFILEEQQWRIVHHQAGPLARPEPTTPGQLMN